jgi:2-iminobutanoate/2-iminopropanoate deaminase
MLKQRLMPPDHWDWPVETPFSQGWRVGDLVFVGGQIAAEGRSQVLGLNDIETQTRLVFQNITKVLSEAGATWADVIKINTYYDFDGTGEEVEDFWRRMTKVRMEFLQNPGPCGTAVRVAGFMTAGLLIEVEVIAALNTTSA